MNRNRAAALVQLLLGAAVAVILVVQVLFLPWLSGEVAAGLPDEAYMRWPILALAVAGLACVQSGLLAVLLLLGRVREGTLFETRSLRFVDIVIGALLAGAGVCAATLAYQSFTVGGPPLWAFLLLAGVAGGLTFALLTWIGRTLLVEAVALGQRGSIPALSRP